MDATLFEGNLWMPKHDAVRLVFGEFQSHNAFKVLAVPVTTTTNAPV